MFTLNEFMKNAAGGAITDRRIMERLRALIPDMELDELYNAGTWSRDPVERGIDALPHTALLSEKHDDGTLLFKDYIGAMNELCTELASDNPPYDRITDAVHSLAVSSRCFVSNTYRYEGK